MTEAMTYIRFTGGYVIEVNESRTRLILPEIVTGYEPGIPREWVPAPVASEGLTVAQPMDPERLAAWRALVERTLRPGEHWRTRRFAHAIDVVAIRDGHQVDSLVHNIAAADEAMAEMLAFGPSDLAELLAAHDFHVKRADAAERERDQLVADLDIESRLRQQVIEERNAVQAKLAEQGVGE